MERFRNWIEESDQWIQAYVDTKTALRIQLTQKDTTTRIRRGKNIGCSKAQRCAGEEVKIRMIKKYRQINKSREMRTNRSQQTVMDGTRIQRLHPLVSSSKETALKKCVLYLLILFILFSLICSFLELYPPPGRCYQLLDISPLDYSGPTRKGKKWFC